MIKVNLLRNRAVVSSGVSGSGIVAGGGLAEGIGKAGFSKLSFAAKASSNLDGDFNTFDCSPAAQLLKLVLLVGFIVPLVAYEKMRANTGRPEISAKRQEVQTYQALKYDKEESLSSFQNLEKSKAKILIRNNELNDLKNDRLAGLYGIDELQTAVPSDVWLTSIDYKGGDRLDVTGQTLLDSGLDRFALALKASKRLSRVNVQKDVTTKNQVGRTLNEFTITMSIVESPRRKNQVEDLDGR